jgi:hypothetical protein
MTSFPSGWFIPSDENQGTLIQFFGPYGLTSEDNVPLSIIDKSIRGKFCEKKSPDIPLLIRQATQNEEGLGWKAFPFGQALFSFELQGSRILNPYRLSFYLL